MQQQRKFKKIQILEDGQFSLLGAEPWKKPDKWIMKVTTLALYFISAVRSALSFRCVKEQFNPNLPLHRLIGTYRALVIGGTLGESEREVMGGRVEDSKETSTCPF